MGLSRLLWLNADLKFAADETEHKELVAAEIKFLQIEGLLFRCGDEDIVEEEVVGALQNELLSGPVCNDCVVDIVALRLYEGDMIRLGEGELHTIHIAADRIDIDKAAVIHLVLVGRILREAEKTGADETLLGINDLIGHSAAGVELTV